MLQTLELSNFAIVDKLSLELSPGLNVLSGETGAGKSILIDALALLIGNRGDTTWIRKGTDSALIQGIFAPHTGIESAARRIAKEGRSTARLNGELVTVGELSERLGSLVVIHGQHASQTLTSSSEQRKLLDRLLDKKAQEQLSQYRQSFAEYSEIRKTLATLKEQLRERARRLDILQFQFDEIEAAKLDPDEVEALQEKLESLRFAERIVGSSGQALNALTEAEPSAIDQLANAHKDLTAASRYSKNLESLSSELSETLSSVQAIADELQTFLDEFDADPRSLESLENRMAKIEDLKRKYGESVEAILSFQAELGEELSSLTQADEKMDAMAHRQTVLLSELEALAENLTKARKQTAKKLSKQVTNELQPLGMEKAVFEVNIAATEKLTAFGKDNIQFHFSANLGEQPAALSNVASGGELSRVMLALNVVTGSDLPVLAFDEVDAGIGGKTARAVGELLKQLAQHHQVLVVTHLPHVAAFADAQFYVAKEEKGGRTVTRVHRLELHERELELARMLSGTDSDAALANARELLSEAQL